MAQFTDIDSEISQTGFFKFTSIGQFVVNLFQVVLIIGAIAAFAFLIWGGVEYISSGGNQDKTKSAKSKISSALAGLAIMAAAWIIWRLVVYFLGISPSLQGPVQLNLPHP